MQLSLREGRSLIACIGRAVGVAGLLGLGALGCGEESSERVPPTDDVIDESAGEEALAVLQGTAPGVAVVAEYPEGTQVDEVTEALAADYRLTVTSRYRDLVLGAAFIAPDQAAADALASDSRVAGLFADGIVRVPDVDAAASEVEEDVAAAQAAGEAEDDGLEGSDAGDDVSIRELTPQIQSSGWKLVNAEHAPADGAGMRVAVLDTGVDYKHPDLEDAVHGTMGKDCMRRENKTTYDLHGHGTHVAGIIAARNNGFGMVGVAPKATIVAVRVLGSDKEGTFSSFLCGLDYVSRHRSRIAAINASLGGVCSGPCADGGEQPHHKAIKKLIRRGVFIGLSAGNDGIPVSQADPAFLEEPVTVSAYMDMNGKLSSTDRYAHFSNYGPGIDIGAPGVRIMSTLINTKHDRHVFARWNGTSMAAPFVVGAAILYKQAYGGRPDEIRRRLIEDARTSYPGRSGDGGGGGGGGGGEGFAPTGESIAFAADGEVHNERLLYFRESESPSGCGDGMCLGDETATSCAADCGCAAVPDCGDVAPFGCYCDAECAEDDTCCPDAEEVCGV